MNGPTHFQQSEAIIAAVMDQHPPEPVAANMLAAAQVHATLALTAAVAATRTTYPGDLRVETCLDNAEWDKVLSGE